MDCLSIFFQYLWNITLGYFYKDCLCCYTMYLKKNLLTCTNNHITCKSCLNNYIEERISSGSINLKCMIETTCNGHYSDNILKKNLDPIVYAKYCKHEIICNLRTIKDIVICPQCNIYAISLLNNENNKFECQNPSCKFISCLKCKKSYHGLLECKLSKQFVGTRTIIENILNKNYKRNCPDCGIKFVRSDGCNKMTCVCGTITCYYCNKKITNYDHHFTNVCPAVTSENIIVDISFEKSLVEIYKLFKRDQKKLRTEVLPILYTLESDKKDIIDRYIKKKRSICLIC